MTKIKSALMIGAALGLATLAGPVLAAEVASGTNEAVWTHEVSVGSASKISISSDAVTVGVIPAVAGSNGGFGVAPVTDLVISTNDVRGSILQLNIFDDSALDDTNSNGTDTSLLDPAATTEVTSVLTTGAVLSGGLNGGDWGFTFVSDDDDAWANAVGTTAGANTAPTVASTFYGVPPKGSPVDLLDANGAAGQRTGYVNFGAVVTYLLESGYTYANTVEFTASIAP